MANALKKIVARVKVLRKKHPNAKYKTLQKQAGREFKAGKLKARRKPAAKKVTRKRTVKRKRISSVGAVASRVAAVRKRKAPRKRAATKKKTSPRRRARVSGSGKSIMPALLLGGLGLAAVYMLTRRNQQPTTYVPTGNYTRDNAASNILAYATAAGLTIAAITKLIQALNSSSDSQVTAANQNPQSYINQFVNGQD